MAHACARHVLRAAGRRPDRNDPVAHHDPRGPCRRDPRPRKRPWPRPGVGGPAYPRGPQAVFDISFQLSFLSVVSIGSVVTLWNDLGLPRRSLLEKARNNVVLLIVISF